MAETSSTPSVAVIGGGFCGAVFAIHLARAATRPLDIEVIEPRPHPGQGVAYGSAGDEHRMNTLSDRLILFKEDPLHFERWLKDKGLYDTDRGAFDENGQHYAKRQAFGDYMAGLFGATARANPSGSTLRHRRARVVQVARTSGGVHLAFDTGDTRDYAAAVLCASYASPATRWSFHDGAEQSPNFVRDPWAPNACAAIAPDADVFIVGTALTMCDMVVSLHRQGHRGRIHAISRHGLLPHRQADFHEDCDLLEGRAPPASAIDLLRFLRKKAREIDAPGVTWRMVADGLRRTLPTIWQALPFEEREKLVRKLRSYWDVHRFRMAPQVDAVLAAARAQGRFTVSAGRIKSVGRAGERLRIRWRKRGGDVQSEDADAVINCTGPDSDLSRSDNPLFRSLVDGGLARPDALRLGLDLDGASRVHDRDGRSDATLWAAGPLARPLLGEVVGVPQTSTHARGVASAVAAALSERVGVKV